MNKKYVCVGLVAIVSTLSFLAIFCTPFSPGYYINILFPLEQEPGNSLPTFYKYDFLIMVILSFILFLCPMVIILDLIAQRHQKR